MMYKSARLIFISLWIYEIQALTLNASIFYESLCPDCRNFIANQAFPTYNKLGLHINLDLVPFGKATTINHKGKFKFTCQHGPKECYANEIQSCAIELFSMEESAEFVDCSMKSEDPASDLILEKCANSTGVPWTYIRTCYDIGQGAKLLARNGARTKALEPALQWVPTVIFNGRFDQSLQDAALKDFEAVVCELLQYEPEGCKKHYDRILLQLI